MTDFDEELRRIVQGEIAILNGSAPPTTQALAHWAVDWSTAWNTEIVESDWLLEPLIARGRGHALYAPAKTGKSLLTLEAAAALATGRPFLSWPGGTRHHTGYLDYEMTLADLIERLTAFGYGPDDDLSHLHYILLPSIPTLDTAEGAQLIVDFAIEHKIEWFAIDTMGRAVAGDENDADTYRAFYRATGIALKGAGVAYHRLDHAGKDVERGQRGSSAKNDDVDVVQKLTRLADGAMRLEATHRRMSWVPESVDLAQIEDELEGTMSHLVAEAEMPSTRVKQLAAALDRIGAPIDVSKREARRLLKEAGESAKDAYLQQALKMRVPLNGVLIDELMGSNGTVLKNALVGDGDPAKDPRRFQGTSTTGSLCNSPKGVAGSSARDPNEEDPLY
jgi:hypothetical protein